MSMRGVHMVGDICQCVQKVLDAKMVAVKYAQIIKCPSVTLL